MKILHTADWHLGKRLENFSRIEEQREVLEEICQIADEQQVDMIVIAGDLFDTFNPSIEANELLYTTLHRLSNNSSRLVLAIAGNHDSPERIEMPDSLARLNGIVFVGFPKHNVKPFENKHYAIIKSDAGFVEIKFAKYDFPLRIVHTPYANEVRMKLTLGIDEKETSLKEALSQHWSELASKYLDDQGFNMLVTHLYFAKKGTELEEEPEGEHSILHVGGAQAIFSENIPAQFHYVALGHLHRYHAVDKKPCPIVYSSSPLAYSFAEANQTKQVVIINSLKGQLVDYKSFALKKGKKLLEATFDNVENAVTWLEENQNALVQIVIKSDTYLQASDKKRLHDAHAGLVNLIPVINHKNGDIGNSSIEIDLTKSIEELFIEYFKTKRKGQNPSDEIINAFREINV